MIVTFATEPARCRRATSSTAPSCPRSLLRFRLGSRAPRRRHGARFSWGGPPSHTSFITLARLRAPARRSRRSIERSACRRVRAVGTRRRRPARAAEFHLIVPLILSLAIFSISTRATLNCFKFWNKRPLRGRASARRASSRTRRPQARAAGLLAFRTGRGGIERLLGLGVEQHAEVVFAFELW